MPTFDVTSLSSKGQIVIPSSLRKELGIVSGAKMVIFSDGVNLLLRPIHKPKIERFKKLMQASQTFAKKNGFKRSNLKKIIKLARNENRS